MKLEGEGLLVRIFVGESDRWEIPEGLVTLEPVQVILYRARDPLEEHTH